jgi:hypothetical protein
MQNVADAHDTASNCPNVVALGWSCQRDPSQRSANVNACFASR